MKKGKEWSFERNVLQGRLAGLVNELGNRKEEEEKMREIMKDYEAKARAEIERINGLRDEEYGEDLEVRRELEGELERLEGKLTREQVKKRKLLKKKLRDRGLREKKNDEISSLREKLGAIGEELAQKVKEVEDLELVVFGKERNEEYLNGELEKEAGEATQLREKNEELFNLINSLGWEVNQLGNQRGNKKEEETQRMGELLE